MNQSRDEADTDIQVEHLLGVVSRHRDERCAQLRDQAREQATILLQQAHAKARVHMHQHIVDIREKYRLRIAAARAHNDTLARLRQQQSGLVMLDQARQPLHEALLRRWDNASSRRLWIDALLEIATRTLLVHDWRIEHPSSWPLAEREALRQQLVPLGAKAPVFVACDDINAGLRIIARGATIDATLVGLLQRKTAIEAVLMARLMPLLAGSAHREAETKDRD
jgi:hypothetical protein